MKMVRLIGLVLVLATVLAWAGTTAYVPLTWGLPTENTDGTPLTNLAGVRVMWGTSSSNYTHSADVGLTNAYTVVELVPGYDYYFNVVAYNSIGIESSPVNEVMQPIKQPGGCKALSLGVVGVQK